MANRSTAGQSPQARLQLLGRAQLVREDLPNASTLRFLPERRFRLAAYVALRGDWVSREELATLFWPDRTQEAARSNLRKLLLEVRALDLPALESDRNGVRWIVANDVADCKAAIACGDVETATALYLGPILANLEGGESAPFGDWLAQERRRLRSSWRDALIGALPRRNASEVLQLAGRLLVDDPFDEDAVVAVLCAYQAAENGAGARAAYGQYAERLMEELGVEPSVRVRAAAAQPRAAAPLSVPASAPASAAAVRFVGRAQELEELSTLLGNAECRLLTVTGPGGIGKSRLVKEAVRRLAQRYADGVLWIALDDLIDLAQVAPRIAGELALTLAPKADPVEQIATHLGPLRLLLVLDNGEHLPRLASLVDRLLARAARLQVLCTSRARIGAAREWLLPLGGLALPPRDESAPGAGTTDAVQLFVAQAQANDPRFDAQGSAALIAQLVRAVGGLPLAILLAASWVRLLPMAELVREVTQSLDLLDGVDDGEERPEHRSVRATFEQSWHLLAPAEQRALAALSVMVGAFSRVAARHVAEAPLPLLAALFDKSLLQVDGQGRFALHPLIQQFAAEKLALDPARVERARDRHAEAFARFMSEFSNFDNLDQVAAVRAIGLELSNVLAAWNWSIKRPLLDVLHRCMAGLSNYFQARGPIGDGLQLFTRAQAAIDVHAEALTGPARDARWGMPLELAALNYWSGEYRTVERCARKALAAARALGNPFGVRTSLNTVALALMRMGGLEEAATLLEEALASARADRVVWEIPVYAGNLVAPKRELGDDQAALALARETLNGHRANGNHLGVMSMLNEIGLIHHGLGQIADAIESYEQALQLGVAAGVDLRRSQLLTHLASACLDAGELDRARESARESLRITLASGLLAHEPVCRRILAAIELARGDVADARGQLVAAIGAARRIGTERMIEPLLRDCAGFFEHTGAVAIAQRCLACAEGNRKSGVTLLARYRQQRQRLQAAPTQSPALSLQEGLDLAERNLVPT